MAQGIAARVCSVCLAPGPLPTLAYARQMALRVVGPVGGALVKVAVSLPVLCAHVRRENTIPKETSPGCPSLTEKRKWNKGRLYHRLSDREKNWHYKYMF